MINLRPIHDQDRDQVYRWRTLPEVANYMYSDHAISQEEHRLWFDQMQADSSCIYQIIEVDEVGVGVVYITGIDRKNLRCSWGFYLASSAVRGRGVGSFVEYSILRIVFDELGLNKLCCEVFDFNKAVIQMHESFGFKKEGTFRQHVQKSGEFHDIVALALLVAEWQENRSAIERRLRAKQILPDNYGLCRS